jgi:hypothetical protein
MVDHIFPTPPKARPRPLKEEMKYTVVGTSHLLASWPLCLISCVSQLIRAYPELVNWNLENDHLISSSGP